MKMERGEERGRTGGGRMEPNFESSRSRYRTYLFSYGSELARMQDPKEKDRLRPVTSCYRTADSRVTACHGAAMYCHQSPSIT